MYHPDVMLGADRSDAGQVKKVEEKFNRISEAHERLSKWIVERDSSMDDKLMRGEVSGVEVN